MAIGDLYRCALSIQLDGQTCVNVMHFEQIGGNADGKAQDCANALVIPMSETWNEFIGGRDWNHLYNLEVTKVDRLVSDFGEASYLNTLNSLNQGRLPTVVQATCSLYTGFQGPSRRGRIFLSGVSIEGVTASQLNAVGLTNAGNFIAKFFPYFVGSEASTGYRIGVFSRKRYEILSNPFDDYFKPVDRAGFQPAVGTMHSRKVGVGS